ncbi:MAG: hypothetical protein ACK5LS_01945 [Propioniciclava sp.]
MAHEHNQHNEHDGEPTPNPESAVEPDTAEAASMTPEKLGDLAIKIATETAYAAAGVADLVARSTRDFIEAQRKQLAERTPEGVDPNFKKFVDGMPDQFKAFLDEMTKTYHDMAERGRGAVSEFQAQASRAARPEPTGAFDYADDVEATDADAVVAADEEVVVEEIIEDSAEGRTDDGSPSGS